MTRYLIRRLLVTIGLVGLIMMVVFFAIHLLPGDPAQAVLGGEEANPRPEQIERVRRELGLDDPITVQFGRFATGALTGDLGNSFVRREPVSQMLRVAFLRTLMVAVPAVLLAASFGIALGLLSARARNSIWDPLFSALALVGFSVPSFVSGLALVLVFAVALGWLPSGGYVHPSDDFRAFLTRAVLPVATLMLPTLAVTMRMTRSSVLEQVDMDYVRTARAKGLSESKVLSRHVLRNALLPIVTVVALQFGNLVTGSVIVEYIFNWPGVGRMLLSAVTSRDYPVIQGTMLYVAVAFVFINFLTDVLYAFIDPRIRYR